MESSLLGDPLPARLSESEWQDLRRLVHDAVGIKLSEAKRIFLISRLHKRLRATNTLGFREYIDLVMRGGTEGEEYQRLINAVTTNKTSFFREAAHYEVLTRWFCDTSDKMRDARWRGLQIWCAAASTGEEPYTIAAVLKARLSDAEWSRVRILASDIDTAVLETARRAVYDEASVAEVEPRWQNGMFVKGRGRFSNQYRVRRELREHVQFAQENLVGSTWNVKGRFDAVFCRNVLIYFHRETQGYVVNRLLDHVEPHGLLFLGAAESINGLGIPVRTVAHSVYAKQGSAVDGRFIRESPAATRKSQPRRPATPPGAEWHELARGQMSTQHAGWVSCVLDESCVVLLHNAVDRRSIVVHARGGSDDTIDEAVRAASSRIHVGRRGSHGGDTWVAKILVSLGGSECTARSQSRTDESVSTLGVRLVTKRVYAGGSIVWIDSSSGRVLVSISTPLGFDRAALKGGPTLLNRGGARDD